MSATRVRKSMLEPKPLFINVLMIALVVVLVLSLVYASAVVIIQNRVINPLESELRELRFSVVSEYMELEHIPGAQAKAAEDIRAAVALADSSRNGLMRRAADPLAGVFIPDSLRMKFIRLDKIYRDIKSRFSAILNEYEARPDFHPDLHELANLTTAFRDLSYSCLNEIGELEVGQLYLFGSTQALSLLFILVAGALVINHYRVSLIRHQADLQEISLKSAELRDACDKIAVSEEQLKASNQQIKASEHQVKAINQQLRAANQQLRAANQQLHANEEALKTSEKRLRFVFDNSRNAILVFQPLEDGANFIVKDLNPAAVKLERLSKERAINQKLTEVLPDMRELGMLEVMRRVNNSSVPQEIPGAFYNGPAIKGWREYYFYKIQTGELVCLYNDFTEKKEMESVLHLYKKSVEHAEDLIAAVNARHELVFVNAAFEQYYRIDLGEIPEKSMAAILGADDFEKNYKMDVASCLQGHRIRYERELGFPALGHRLMQVTYYPLHDENREETVAILVMKDITDRLRIEEERQKVQRLESIGLLAGGVAHDFNNLLQSIFGYIGLARELSPDKSEVAEHLTQALSAFKRAKDLTDQLLTFSKGGLPVKSIVRIDQLLQDAVQLSLSGSNIKATVSIDRDLWAAEVDEGQIHQVFSNILINARQAMPSGGNLFLSASNCVVSGSDLPHMDEGKYIEVKIRDSGHGIPKENLAKIFDPFFTTKQSGSGLGLAIAYSIIKKHNGYINAVSTLGEGSTFLLFIPAVELPAAKKEAEEARLKKGSGTILIMDDESLILDVAKKTLEYYGYSVLTAPDGQRAIEAFQKAVSQGVKVKAVILDLTVPGGMGGKEAVKCIKEIDPEAKVLLSSGYFDDPVFSEPETFGFDGAIQKPYKIRDLIRAVQKLSPARDKASPG